MSQSDLSSSINASDSKGLLAGMHNVLDEKCYSKCINIEDAAALVNNRANIYDNALLDCGGDLGKLDGYLESIVSKSNEFMDENKVWDREDLKAAIDLVISNKGQFVCLLGGRSTGKTFLLKDIANANKDNVFFIDLRQEGNIIKALLESVSIQSAPGVMVDRLKSIMSKVAANIVGIASKGAISKDDFPNIIEYLSRYKPKETLTGLLKDLSSTMVPTLIIDEANIALAIDESTPVDKIDIIKSTLSLFISLTKADKKVSIVVYCYYN